YLGFNCLGTPQHLHKYFLARMTGPQCVREIVQILNGFTVEFRQNIAGLQPRFRRRRSGPYIRELYSIRQFGEVRNAAEIRTIPAARQATRMWIRHVAWSRLRGNANELWPWRAILYKMIRYIRHQGQQPHRIRAIDLVPGVARLVI